MFELIPSDDDLREMPNAEFCHQLEELREYLSHIDTDDDRERAITNLSKRQTWQVKYELLRAAKQWLPLPAAKEFILNCTHDSVDVVAFLAIQQCGELRAPESVPHLVRISGWPSKFSRNGYLRKPVGIGAALSKHALVTTLGSSDPDVLAARETQILEPMRRALALLRRTASIENMIYVPGGDFVFGTNEPDARLFFFQDYLPEQTVKLTAYYIDKHPVTNAQFREFLAAIDSEGHRYCHPDEPPAKDHASAHWRDPRFGADDMPVTGVDWYDAYAYANWAGKKLPTEQQWEKAARGTVGNRYPWGNEWTDGACNWFGESFRSHVSNLAEWEELLRSFSADEPREPLRSVGSMPAGDSVYGVSEMAGNVWEWTRTNFYTRKDMDPFFKLRHPPEFMNRPAAFPVIRGGCFTSLPEMLRTYYRGKDLLTDRHCEIGFRCVVEA
jgi:gamma-glutamyl hercynylcysteine S-oxide synthase